MSSHAIAVTAKIATTPDELELRLAAAEDAMEKRLLAAEEAI